MCESKPQFLSCWQGRKGGEVVIVHIGCSLREGEESFCDVRLVVGVVLRVWAERVGQFAELELRPDFKHGLREMVFFAIC